MLTGTVLMAMLDSGSARGAAAPAAPAASGVDGKAVFMAQKCSLCHSVSSAGIERTVKSEKMAGPDLTNLAAKEDPAKLTKFLHKEIEINGKKHGKTFTGSDAELAALISWLQQQKK